MFRNLVGVVLSLLMIAGTVRAEDPKSELARQTAEQIRQDQALLREVQDMYNQIEVLKQRAQVAQRVQTVSIVVGAIGMIGTAAGLRGMFKSRTFMEAITEHQLAGAFGFLGTIALAGAVIVGVGSYIYLNFESSKIEEIKNIIQAKLSELKTDIGENTVVLKSLQ